MSDEEIVDAVAALLRERTGLRTTAATRARLESCVRQRAGACAMSMHRYLDHVRRDPAEPQVLVDGLTVQETSFFRDRAHIDALLWHVVARRTGPVVVWSAGCATGQEPYSLAMAFDEAGIADWRIVATDLSRPAVERTLEGSYRESELRGLSAARRGRYLRRDGDRYRIDERLRERITVSHHNLLSDPVPLRLGEATAVFCRNVFFYLQRDRVAGFLSGLRRHLTDDGVLFLGGSESLWHVPEGFSLVQLGETFAYRCDRPPVVAATTTATAPPSPPVRRPVPTPPRSSAHDVSRTSVLVGAAPSVERTAVERTAVERFRADVYTDPDDPLAHLQLGLSLQADGDEGAGRRAFRAARAALDRATVDEGGIADLEARLEGYGIAALRDLLDAKISETVR